MFPAIVLFCCFGACSVHNSSFDVLLMAAVAIGGFVLLKLRCELVPLILGFLMEENLRRALLIPRGNFGVFL